MALPEFREYSEPPDRRPFQGGPDGAQPPIEEVVTSQGEIPRSTEEITVHPSVGPSSSALERVTARLDQEEAEALRRAAQGGDQQPPTYTVPTSLENIAGRLGPSHPKVRALYRAVEAGSVDDPAAIDPAPVETPAIESVVARLGDESDEAQALRRAAIERDTPAIEAKEDEEPVPLPEHGVDRVAPFVSTHLRIHPPGSYHSDASFEKIGLQVNPDTGAFIMVGSKWVHDGEGDMTVEYTVIDPGTGVPLDEPVRTIWRVDDAWVDTWKGDNRAQKVIAKKGTEYPNWDERARGSSSKVQDITAQLPDLTPDGLVEIAGKMTKEGVKPKLALRGMIDENRAEGKSPKSTTPIRRDYEFDVGTTILRHDQLAPLNEVHRAVVSTMRHILTILPTTPGEAMEQVAVGDALNVAAGGFREGALADYRYDQREDSRRITNPEIEHARNAVRAAYAEPGLHDLPDQDMVERYLAKLIAQAEANGGIIETPKLRT